MLVIFFNHFIFHHSWTLVNIDSLSCWTSVVLLVIKIKLGGLLCVVPLNMSHLSGNFLRSSEAKYENSSVATMVDNMQKVLIGKRWMYTPSCRVQPGKHMVTGNPTDGSPLNNLSNSPTRNPIKEPWPLDMLKKRTQTSWGKMMV